MHSHRVSLRASTFDIPEGGIWRSDLPKFLKLLARDPRVHAASFWDALWTFSTTKYGHPEAAFMAFCDSRDGLLSAEQFRELCEALGLTAAPSILLLLFESRPRMGEAAWTLQEFLETVSNPQLKKLRSCLQAYAAKRHQILGHIDRFVRNLVLNSDEDTRRRAVARFQRKITMDVCVRLWRQFQSLIERRQSDKSRSPARSRSIDCANFLHFAETSAVFQEHEVEFLANIFSRIDRARVGRVSMADLAVTLTLLAGDATREEKMRHFFSIFDTECNGCLSSEQMLHMLGSVAIHGAIAKADQPTYDADLVLGDELSLSKARRLFEHIASHLCMESGMDLCTFEELWSALGTQTFLLDDIVPNANSLLWVLHPSGPVINGASPGRPEASERRKSRRPRGTIVRRNRSKEFSGERLPRLPSLGAGDSVSSSFPHSVGSKFGRGSWMEVHKETISDWAQGGFHMAARRAPQDRSGAAAYRHGRVSPTMRTTRSLPSLRGPHQLQTGHPGLASGGRRQLAAGPGGTAGRRGLGLGRSMSSTVLADDQQSMQSITTADNAVEAASERMEAVKGQVADMVHAMPSDVQRFGREAIGRFRHVSQSMASRVFSAKDGKMPKERVRYNCHTCEGQHVVDVPCFHG